MNRNTKKKLWVLGCIAVLAGRVPAAQFDLSWYTVDCGGTTSAMGGSFELAGTVGQADAGPGAPGMSGGSFELTGGFWGLAATVTLPCEGDANNDGLVDPLDVGYVLSRFGCAVGSGDDACDAADQNGSGVVDPLDAGYVLSRFGDCD